MSGKRKQMTPNKKDIDILNKYMVGQKITDVRWLTREQTDDYWEHWYDRPIQITLENGITLIPMADDEGNEAGVMSTTIPNMEIIWAESD